MNGLMTFTSPEFGKVRTVEINGEPWLVGKDVAKALGYKSHRDALAKHVDAEDKGVAKCDSPSGEQQMTIINESGLYSLILSSKLPGAKQFKRWVTSEVLPAIRKQGGYLTPEAAAAVEQIPAMLARMGALEDKIAALEGARPGRALSPELEEGGALPGQGAKRRWMRALSEKLDLLSTRSGRPHNALLHDLYRFMEERCQVVLDEERLKAMERLGLSDCSALTAIFYNPALKDVLQRNIDYNLAPENRGW